MTEKPTQKTLVAKIPSIAHATTSAAILGLGLVFPSYWWISAFGVIGLIALIDGRSVKSAFWRGLLFGTVLKAVSVYWLGETLTRFSGLPSVGGQLLAVVLFAYIGLQIAVFAALCARIHTRGMSRIWVYPVVWVAVEYLWIQVFPWRLGHFFAPCIGLIQISEFTGVYGVSFIMIWGAAVIWWLIRHIRGLMPQFRWDIQLPVFLSVLAVILVFGAWRIHDIEQQIRDHRRIRVALIQPSVRVENRFIECKRQSMLARETADLICWPESSVPAYPLDMSDLRSHNARPLPGGGAYVLCCGASRIRKDKQLYYNTAFLIDRQEQIIDRYHKRILIPFGEYIPGEHWFPSLHKLSPFESRFRVGQSAAPVIIDDQQKIGVLICYEDLRSNLARDSVAAGATMLANLTNDFWFGETKALPQHQQLALFRTVETRRYMVRCTTSGSSSIISPTGKVVAQAPLFEATTLQGDVKPLFFKTVYVRIGDSFSLVCVLIVLVVLIYGYYSQQRSNNSGSHTS